MKKRLFTLGCMVFTCFCSFSQLKNWSSHTSHDMVTCMLNNENNLWIGTNGGLVRLNKQTGGKQFFNRSNGLPSTAVSALAMNDEGELWLSSEDCIISKYNGTGFDILEATESLQSNCSNYALAIDEQNRIWYGALCVYSEDKETGKGTILGWEVPNTAVAPFIMVNSYLFTNIGDKELLYIGGYFFGGNFLLEFDGKSLNPILKGQISSTVTGMSNGKNGDIWIATQNNGLVNYAADETVTFYNTSNSTIPGNCIYDIETDKEGNLWLACGCSLVKFDGKDFTTFQTELIEPMNGMNFILTVMPDEDGTVWVGTKRQGLFKFINDTFTEVDINPISSLTDSYMGFSMCMDKNGNIWNAGRKELLKIDRNNEWHSLFKLDYIPTSNRVQAVGSDLQGNVWVALSMSDTCVVKMSPDGKIIEAFTKSTHPTLAAGTQREGCFAFGPQGNVWWGTFAALYQYDGKEWKYYTSDNSPMPCSAVTDLKIDNKGTLWGTLGYLGKNGALFKLEDSAWTIYSTENSGLPTSFPMCLDIDSNNRIWMHCRDKGGEIGKNKGGGLTCFDGNKWVSYTIQNSYIPSNTIWDIVVDKYDRIWMGTAEAGLTCLEGNTWTNYNMENSDIASNEVSCILIDEYRNYIWMNHLSGSGISSAEFDDAHNLSKISVSRDTRIRAIGSTISCTSPTATKLEIYTMDGVKVGEADFANGEATVKVGKTPATYLYIVTYPNGRRESGKVAVKN